MITEPNMITVTLSYRHKDEVLHVSLLLHRHLNETAAAMALQQFWRNALLDLEHIEAEGVL